MGDRGLFKFFLLGAFVFAVLATGVPSQAADESMPTAEKAEFKDNGDGTVTDGKNRLTWQKEDDGTERDWKEAGEYCKGLDLGGHKDWRLPEKKEMVTLWWGAGSKEDIRAKFFPEMKKAYYWTATTFTYTNNVYGKDPVRAFSLNFTEGRSVTDSRDAVNIVRCVRP
ncbi:MAG: DUF1566 domain-containing protein [Nitrospinae bacterium]|nr:DUF1566 domain-containing protein [Nitrospinota bacterium]